MEALGFAVAIGSAVLALSRLARRTGRSEPAALLLGGVAPGFVPGLRDVTLPPQVVLYWETLNTSLRQIRANLRVIVLLSIGLVVATASRALAAAGPGQARSRRRITTSSWTRPTAPSVAHAAVPASAQRSADAG